MRRFAVRAGSLARALAAAVALAVVAAPAAAIADDDVTTWAVQPSSAEGPDGRDAFTYTLAPGEAVTDYVGVSNLGSEPLELRVYAMDAAMTADGAFTLPPADTVSTTVGSWVGFNGEGVFTVEPGTRIDVPFRLSVPPTASPGDHAGGIVASVVELASGGEGAQQVAVDRRVGARVYINVPGDQLPAVDVSDVQIEYGASPILAPSPADVTMTLTNTGNMRIGGTADVTITGPFGIGMDATRTIELPEILPGATVQVSGRIEDVPPAGLLTATVTLDPTSSGDGGDVAGTHTASGIAWAVPWVVLVVVLAVLAIIAFVWVRIRRLRARLAAAEAAAATPRESVEPDAATAPEPETASSDDDFARRGS